MSTTAASRVTESVATPMAFIFTAVWPTSALALAVPLAACAAVMSLSEPLKPWMVASMFVAAAASSALSIGFAVMKLRDKYEECELLQRQTDLSKRQLKRHAALIQSFHLEKLALVDELTDLPNRRMLLNRLPQVVSQTRRRTTRMALLLVSLNGFKAVNQRHGNQVGDLVLREIAARLKRSVRTSDTVARYGGDVFAILLEEVMGNDAVARADVSKLATKYLALCSEAVQIFSDRIMCTASIGFAVSSALTQSAQEIISDAETALTAAKTEGVNSFCIWPLESGKTEAV